MVKNTVDPPDVTLCPKFRKEYRHRVEIKMRQIVDIASEIHRNAAFDWPHSELEAVAREAAQSVIDLAHRIERASMERKEAP
jgi:hypothetical protein